MYHIDNSTAAASLPTPAAAGTAGFFTDGTPGFTPATVVPADWLNMVGEELRSILTAAGITPSKTVNNQVLASVQAIFASLASPALTGNPTAPTPAVADNDTSIATTAFVQAAGASALNSTGRNLLHNGLFRVQQRGAGLHSIGGFVMAIYRLRFGGEIERTSDGAMIPADPANRDYAEFLDWQDSGGVADPFIAPVDTPAQAAIKQLQDKDVNMFRVLELLIDVLIAKGTIAATDFPPGVRAMYLSRKSLRNAAGVA